jgi:alpha-beta hydrolase superfamily lysophospholipase
VPTLILHGDDDQIVPIGAAALMSAKIVKNATLKAYPAIQHWKQKDWPRIKKTLRGWVPIYYLPMNPASN